MSKCNMCSRSFTLVKNLRRHMKNIHKLNMKSKQRSINNQKSKHKCSLCHLIFIERSSLRRHEKLKHDIYVTPNTKSFKSIKYTCATFEPSNLYDYSLLKKMLPEDYVYKVIHIENLEQDKFRAKFEIADCTENIFQDWLSELSKKSMVTYRVKSFTKSSSSKIVFNKVYRCIHNTFPKKNISPHPKHTGCASTLNVRIKKCNEALSMKNIMGTNNVIMISLKAIITLYHCHNHLLLKSSKLYSFGRKEDNETISLQLNETLINHIGAENSVSQVYDNESNSSNTTLSNTNATHEAIFNTNATELFEDYVTLYESKSNEVVMNNYSKNMHIDNGNFELTNVVNDFILTERLETDNSLYNDNNKKEIHQLLADYDTVNEKMQQQFKSNPTYFLPAIKAYIFTMKNNFTSKSSLLKTLHSFSL